MELLALIKCSISMGGFIPAEHNFLVSHFLLQPAVSFLRVPRISISGGHFGIHEVERESHTSLTETLPPVEMLHWIQVVIANL